MGSFKFVFFCREGLDFSGLCTNEEYSLVSVFNLYDPQTDDGLSTVCYTAGNLGCLFHLMPGGFLTESKAVIQMLVTAFVLVVSVAESSDESEETPGHKDFSPSLLFMKSIAAGSGEEDEAVIHIPPQSA